ncbi:hypothetical protein OAA86_09875 [Rhodospirillales bacterium]|nr:hypothetical protein [Rhodospirillales bacterium]
MLTEAQNAFSASPDNVRDRLMDAASAFVAFQRERIGLVEHELLPKAAEVLSPEDWNHIEKALRSNTDPVLGKMLKRVSKACSIGSRHRIGAQEVSC